MRIIRQYNVIGLRAVFPACLFRHAYAYLDSREMHSFRVFQRKGLRGVRLTAVYRQETIPRYSLVCCELDKRKKQEFLEALDELQRDLQIFGYQDYEQACDELFRPLEQTD